MPDDEWRKEKANCATDEVRSPIGKNVTGMTGVARASGGGGGIFSGHGGGRCDLEDFRFDLGFGRVRGLLHVHMLVRELMLPPWGISANGNARRC